MSDIPQVVVEPLSAAAFQPFGQTLASPAQPGRCFFNEMLENTRTNARVDLSIATIPPLAGFPLRATVMERHPCSSQTFIPIRVSRYLVTVAPDAPDGGPDLARARCFLVDGKLGVTYRRGVWHHGMTVLDETAEMAVLMWCDGGSDDEEFLDIAAPFDIILPAAGTTT